MQFIRKLMRASVLIVEPEAMREGTKNIEAMRALNASLKLQQLHPVWAVESTLKVIAGNRRVLAGRLNGDDLELDVNLVTSPLDATTFQTIRLTENLLREELTPYERWQDCQKLLALNPKWQSKDLAAHLKLDAGMITRILSLGKCLPVIQEHFKAGQLSISDCYAFSRLPAEEQHQALREKLENGVSRDELERKVRRQRQSARPAVKGAALKRLVIPLATGCTVTVSGQNVGYDEFIEALSDAAKEGRKAQAQRLDVKTFARMMADKAKGRPCAAQCSHAS